MEDSITLVETPAGRVAVRIAGEGPAVLLIHGIPGSAREWNGVADGLVAAGFRVLVPDLLGFGASDRPVGADGLWLNAQAGMLTELLAASQAKPFIAVGHDYGAPVCVTLAHLNPMSISGLVLAAGNLFTDTPIPAPLKAATMPILGNLSAKVMFSGPMLRMMLRIGVGRPRVPLDPAVYLGDGGQRRTIATIFSTALRELPARYREVEVGLKGLHQPTVILWGDRDPFLGVEQAHRARAAIPNAHLRIERNAGHFLPAERPASFLDAVGRVDRANRH